jgi:hypothetical protein
MKRRLVLLSFCFVLFLFPALLQAQVPPGVSVTCDNGATFDNGVEIIVNQMRSGFTYTATAIGLNGFDPVLAVLGTNTGEGRCSDDEPAASEYAANLPTTGRVSASNLTAQVNFDQNSSNTFEDVSLVVGGFGNATGEFIVILEGMGVTSGDGAGDIFSVNLTPGMVASGIPLTVYMLARDASLDTTIFQVDSSLNTFLDENDNVIGCDDAGNGDICWGESVDLSDSSVTLGTGALSGGPFDSMLSLGIDNVALDEDPSLNYFNFAMTSSPQNTTQGQYVLAFHIGMTEAQGGGGKSGFNSGGQESQGGDQTAPTPVPETNTNVGTGVSVTCDNGTSFDNGIEVLISLESDVTYTATAIGLNGFDPVLAVLNTDTGDGLCNDDNEDAAGYGVDLPTTGAVSSDDRTAQIVFSQDTGNTFSDMSLIVGGFGNTSGEFVLILEGMTATGDDDEGDVVNVNLTPGMLDSGVPLTIYMIANTNTLDPYIVRTDADLNPLSDSNDDEISCDDAGSSNLCWGDSAALSDSSITLGGSEIPGGGLDAMLSRDLGDVNITADRTQNYFVYVAGDSPNTDEPTEGPYTLVFHMGQSD